MSYSAAGPSGGVEGWRRLPASPPFVPATTSLESHGDAETRSQAWQFFDFLCVSASLRETFFRPSPERSSAKWYQPHAQPNARRSRWAGHWVTWPTPTSPNVYGRFSSEAIWKSSSMRRPRSGRPGYSTPAPSPATPSASRRAPEGPTRPSGRPPRRSGRYPAPSSLPVRVVGRLRPADDPLRREHPRHVRRQVRGAGLAGASRRSSVLRAPGAHAARSISQSSSVQ